MRMHVRAWGVLVLAVALDTSLTCDAQPNSHVVVRR